MRVVAEVVVVPDDPRTPTTQNRADVYITPESLQRFLAGEYPATMQIFIEAALPKLVKDTIKEASA